MMEMWFLVTEHITPKKFSRLHQLDIKYIHNFES